MDQTNPRQSFLSEDVLVGREVLWMIEATGSNVDFIRPCVYFVSKGGATDVAESPPRAGARAVWSWGSHLKFNIGTSYRDPCNRLGPDSPPAIITMAIGLATGLLGRSEAHLATVTAAGDCCAFHASQPGFRWERKRCRPFGVGVGCGGFMPRP